MLGLKVPNGGEITREHPGMTPGVLLRSGVGIHCVAGATIYQGSADLLDDRSAHDSTFLCGIAGAR